MLSLLQKRDQKNARARETLRARVREELRRHLQELAPGSQVWVFGSLCQQGHFHRESDIDIAFEALPDRSDLCLLTGELMERLGRPVDIILLPQSRLTAKIKKEGERWTL